MFVRRKTRPVRQSARHASAGARPGSAKAPLDAAGLLLELDMAALIRDAEGSLRQHRDERRGLGGWWRRLFDRSAKQTAPHGSAAAYASRRSSYRPGPR